MRIIKVSLVALPLLALFSAISFAQGDVRSATGMPIPIGAPVIWGQIELRGLKPNEPRPVVSVALLVNGVQSAQSQANDRGFYYFIQRVRDGSMLVVSVGGMEVGRQVLSSAGGERYDMVIDWRAGVGNDETTGVVYAESLYPSRSEPNQKLFSQAMAASKANNSDRALQLYEQIVAADAKDFVAWTEIGSLHFARSKHGDAERAYQRALELKPDYIVALMNLGKLHLSKNDPDKAIPIFTRAADADKTSADAFHYLGEAFLLAKQGSKAVIVLNEALRLSPNEKAEIHLRLAALYNAAGLKDRAANEYQMFLKKRPNYPERSKLEEYIKTAQK